MLLFFIAVGATLRYWAIDFGLPGKYRPDEEYLINPAKRFLSGDLNPRFFFYPSFYMYFLSVVFLCFKSVLGVTYQTFSSLMGSSWDSSLYFLGRFTSASFGVATIYIVYKYGTLLFNKSVALIAAAFLVVNFCHVRESHFATTDIPLAALTTVALLLLVKLQRRGSILDYCLVGLFVGLAVSTKYSALSLGVPAVVAHFCRAYEKKIFIFKFSEIKRALLALLSGAVAFIATSPYFILEWDIVQRNFTYQKPFITGGLPVKNMPFGFEWLFDFALRNALGLPLLFCSVLGMLLCIALFFRKEKQYLIVLPPICYLVALSWVFIESKWIFFRYLTIMVPILCIFGAFLTYFIFTRFKPKALFQIISVFLISIVLVGNLKNSFQFTALLAKADNREIARSWLERNIKKDQRILMQANFFYGKPTYPYPRFTVYPGDNIFPPSNWEWLIVDRHPSEYFCPVPSDTLQRHISEKTELAASILPFKEWPYQAEFELVDAFYLPFDNFDSVNRAGPALYFYKNNAARRGIQRKRAK